MDWSKAKRIMIFAFLVVNISLLLIMTSKNIRAKDYITSKEDVIERLEKINVDFKTEIPEKTPNIELLEVEYEEYDTINKKLDIANEFLSSSDLLQIANIDNEKDSIIFEDDKEKFEILKGKKIIYEDKTRNNNSPMEFDPEKVASDFLKEKGFENSDHKMTKLKKNNDIVELNYTKLHINTILEKSYMKVIIKNGKVISFERLWLNVIEEKENNIELRPATDSLLKLLSVEGIRDKTIDKIELCYYFDSNDADIFDFSELKAGDAVPVWKVQFTDGTIKYLYEE
ncbi:MAG: hypothetical protein ACTH0B_03200 [Senegalia sp. (in: firmicutes)]